MMFKRISSDYKILFKLKEEVKNRTMQKKKKQLAIAAKNALMQDEEIFLISNLSLERWLNF